MTSKEALEKLLNDINEQAQVIATNPNLMVTFNVNLEMFTATIENALKDLERLETLENAIKIFLSYLTNEPNRAIAKHSIKQTFNKLLKEELGND